MPIIKFWENWEKIAENPAGVQVFTEGYGEEAAYNGPAKEVYWADNKVVIIDIEGDMVWAFQCVQEVRIEYDYAEENRQNACMHPHTIPVNRGYNKKCVDCDKLLEGDCEGGPDD